MNRSPFARSLLFAIGVCLAFSLLVLTNAARELTHAGLEGRLFARYYAIFVPLLCLTLLFSSYLSFARLTEGSLIPWIIVGTICGYICGVISFVAIELFKPAGMHMIAEQSHHVGDWIFRLVYPLISLNWLVGMGSALTAFLLNNMVQRLDRRGG